MNTFVTNKTELAVYDKQLNQDGILRLGVRIEIRGNHLKGPVRVKVKYLADFQPSERYWEVDAEYPADEAYSVNYMMHFDSEEERNFYLSTRYGIGKNI